MARLAALIVLVIPGILAAYGIKLMRDTFFGISNLGTAPLWFQFVLGLALMVLGIGFFAGFLLRRDRKNGRVSERFKEKKAKSD
ncbi:DUF2627 domain-containing protein [Chryseomicrobium aureum]|uniref:DUF2627 domain-containing protein n=1 Tax=Chryseomicrobium aureum TaxID=1441723 RepID=UPI00195B80A6|nr:DUF2627 domain-containing protein [Chryseomicrobium aureum]MBM7705693.1 membrane protein implicated in regulation of membrane protease activity [Chryseomicrobium aureum]